MRVVIHIMLLAGALLLTGHAAVAGSGGKDDPGKLLYLSLFYGDVVNIDAIDIAGLPEDIQARVHEYKTRSINFESRLGNAVEYHDAESKMIGGAVLRNRKNIKRGIVSLINEEGIETIAAEYADSAKTYYEWEGFSEPPLDEAGHAEEFLRKNHDTPLKPYLILFIIHRYRHALNALEHEENTHSDDVLTAYERYLKLGREHPDPLVRWFSNYIADAESLF